MRAKSDDSRGPSALPGGPGDISRGGPGKGPGAPGEGLGGKGRPGPALAGLLCLAALLGLLLGPFRGPGALWAATGGDCQGLAQSSARKMAEEKARDVERRRENRQGGEGGGSFLADCLGGVYRPLSFPGFPAVPGPEEGARALCQDLRDYARTPGLDIPSPWEGLRRPEGANRVNPWDGILSGEIWDALRD